MRSSTKSPENVAVHGKSEKKKTPRYVTLADELRKKIIDGRYKDPGRFPTESELCKHFDVSRFTVREALRVLTNEGLIKRKRGSGTVVQPASRRAGALHQPLSNVGEIMQYAHDTSITFKTMEPQGIPKRIREQIGMDEDEEWFVYYGKRTKPDRRRPIALTVAWINPQLAGIVGKIDPDGETLFAQIQEYAGVKVSRITQDIQAIKAAKQFAEDLGIEEDDPILRILRCYFDQNDRMFEISASYHPGDRFAYSMHIEAD